MEAERAERVSSAAARPTTAVGLVSAQIDSRPKAGSDDSWDMMSGPFGSQRDRMLSPIESVIETDQDTQQSPSNAFCFCGSPRSISTAPSSGSDLNEMDKKEVDGSGTSQCIVS
mmetsp:Transcript_9146/g.23254  ORF Transcript_9146/g.23254 Transcript_9146/m.23254 type:complete len:114 (+) Transcript_9146:31-372(+)